MMEDFLVLEALFFVFNLFLFSSEIWVRNFTFRLTTLVSTPKVFIFLSPYCDTIKH